MFLHSQPMLATASLSGVLGVWDLSSYRLRQQCKHPVSTLKCVMYLYVSLREYSHISINDQLSTTANVFFFGRQSIHSLLVQPLYKSHFLLSPRWSLLKGSTVIQQQATRWQGYPSVLCKSPSQGPST